MPIYRSVVLAFHNKCLWFICHPHFITSNGNIFSKQAKICHSRSRRSKTSMKLIMEQIVKFVLIINVSNFSTKSIEGFAILQVISHKIHFLGRKCQSDLRWCESCFWNKWCLEGLMQQFRIICWMRFWMHFVPFSFVHRYLEEEVVLDLMLVGNPLGTNHFVQLVDIQLDLRSKLVLRSH